MKTILLVEDTVDLAEEIRDILRLEGFRVVLGSDAVHAMEILKKTIPDLVITDLLMPVMDGFELVRNMRALPSLQSVPVIILSAKTAPADKLKGIEVGANAFIQKPCKAYELIGCIKGLI